jgi:hypothetical protein
LLELLLARLLLLLLWPAWGELLEAWWRPLQDLRRLLLLLLLGLRARFLLRVRAAG